MHPLLESLRSFNKPTNGLEYQHAVVKTLKEALENTGASVQLQDFKAPKSFGVIVWWGVLVLILLLVLAPVFRYIDLVFLLIWVIWIYNFIAGKATPFTKLPPLVDVQNVIGHCGRNNAKAKVIILANYDTATAVLSQTKHTKLGYLVFMLLVGVATATAVNEVLFPNQDYLFWIKHGLILYFLGQALVISFGKRASDGDNLFGVVAAFEVFKYLKGCNLENVEVDVVFSGAAQVNGAGAYCYAELNRAKMLKQPTLLLNFDGIDAETLKIANQTGIIERYVYDNLLTNTAIQLTANDARFKNVALGEAQVFGSESVWFHQIGIPCLTLTAANKGVTPQKGVGAQAEISLRLAIELATETLRLSLLSLKI